ncbi:hypothetical protein PBI_TRIKE_58 [Mycobacterium phage Trike]|uniref:hypothetical protein n=1 Tax=Mycobacterium phage Trike TaxID=1527536 RepID=UPI0004EF9493|nr:hypothetical protein VC70_gp13 [Mycobacterium phage Trike]AIK69097.1 hypothetical protein PBI_TRIKE_58 [Mycobacterium phage Trike]
MTATPNVMPRKANVVQQKLLAGLIETAPSSWKHKTLAKDKDGKEVVVERRVSRRGLRYPLAQNVTEANVDRLAKRWIA